MRKGLTLPLILIVFSFVYYIEKEPLPKKPTLVERGIATETVPDKEWSEVEKSWAELKKTFAEVLTDNLIAVDKAVFGDLFDKKNLRPEKTHDFSWYTKTT